MQAGSAPQMPGEPLLEGSDGASKSTMYVCACFRVKFGQRGISNPRVKVEMNHLL